MFTPQVARILTRILGPGTDIEDLTQEVFIRAFDRIDTLQEPRALGGWITSIAVFVARETIRKRKRGRWLFFLAPEKIPEVPVDTSPRTADAAAVLHAMYAVIATMPVDAQTAFTLRYIEGLDLAGVAASCRVSLATIKRRLRTADECFVEGAAAHPVLDEWIKEGSRWSRR